MSESKVVTLPAGRRRGRRCPICGRPVVQQYRPFCSRRCADIDLGRWLNGNYRVPSSEPVDDETLRDDENREDPEGER